MTNARQILEEFTASLFVDPKKAAKCLLQDGAFEMPYLDSLSAFDGPLSITIVKISPRKRACVQEWSSSWLSLPNPRLAASA
jgi:hypothetical protein